MSKFLNRIAPQDEVLLEADIGTMVPSAEQLAEERVTRFNADKEIRLRVKALEEKAPDAAVEAAKNQALATIDTKAQAVNTALDGKLATANTAITEAVGKAEQAKGDAVKAQGEASKSAESASTSASNAKTSEQNAKQTADSLNAGLATLNSFDGRVGTLETQVAPTMAGGLLDVQLGHNAMVKVVKPNQAKMKALATEFGLPSASTSTVEAGSGNYIRCAGLNNYWFFWTCNIDLLHVCDTELNYKFSVDVSLTYEQWDALGAYKAGNKHRNTTSQFQNFNGNGLAVTPDGTRLFLVLVGYTNAAATAPILASVRSWDLTNGALLKSNFITLRSDYGATWKNDFVNVIYLPNAKKLLVGGEFLVDADTLEVTGTIADATTTSSGAKSIATAQVAYGKKSGYGVTFTGTQVAVINRWTGGPVYVDDLTDPTTPTLRNFVDTNGSSVNVGFQGFACAELTSSWANNQTFLVRVADGKLAWRPVTWTFPSDTAEMKAVVGAETTSQIPTNAFTNVIFSQGHFKGSSNNNKPLCYVSLPGSILHIITTLNPTGAIPAVDTMSDLGSLTNNRATVWYSPQTNYGYLIPQSGTSSSQASLSVILKRLVVR